MMFAIGGVGEMMVSITWRLGPLCLGEVEGGNRERVQGIAAGEGVLAHLPGGQPGPDVQWEGQEPSDIAGQTLEQ